MAFERTQHPFDLTWISQNLFFCMGWALFVDMEPLITRDSQTVTDWNVTVKIQAFVEDYLEGLWGLLTLTFYFQFVFNSCENIFIAVLSGATCSFGLSRLFEPNWTKGKVDDWALGMVGCVMQSCEGTTVWWQYINTHWGDIWPRTASMILIKTDPTLMVWHFLPVTIFYSSPCVFL